MLTYINQDITTVTDGLVCHGVNCQGVMGGGAALAIRNRWPSIYREYRKMPFEEEMLGVAHIIGIDNGLSVANCYTQVNFGNVAGVKYASVDAIRKALLPCYRYANLFCMTLRSVKIGSDLGGLDWESEVRPIFEELNSEYEDVNTSIYYI